MLVVDRQEAARLGHLLQQPALEVRYRLDLKEEQLPVGVEDLLGGILGAVQQRPIVTLDLHRTPRGLRAAARRARTRPGGSYGYLLLSASASHIKPLPDGGPTKTPLIGSKFGLHKFLCKRIKGLRRHACVRADPAEGWPAPP